MPFAQSATDGPPRANLGCVFGGLTMSRKAHEPAHVVYIRLLGQMTTLVSALTRLARELVHLADVVF